MGYIGYQIAQHVIRHLMAELFLQLDSCRNLVGGYMTRTFHHYLHAGGQSSLHQFSHQDQALHLSPVQRVSQTARSDSISDTQNYIIFFGYLQNAVKLFVI